MLASDTRRDNEQELKRTTRALRVLSTCGRAVIQAEDEASLFSETCRIIVDAGGYALAWIGIAEDIEGKPVRTAAASGRGGTQYLDEHGITWGDEPHGFGPTGTCIRAGSPAVCRHSATDPNFEPWRERAARHGYNSLLALPIRSEGRIFGALTIYSHEPDAFDAEERRLLEELAANLSFGVDARRRQAERDRAEAALRESEAQFRTVFENVNDGIIIIDLEGRILEANKVLCRRLGYTREELLQMNVQQIDNPETRARFTERVAASLRTAGDLFEGVHTRKDGSEVPVEINSRSFEYRGKPAILGVTRDITERKRAEAEAAQRAGELERAKSDAEAANRAKSEFLARMSHEMRTPMNGITGMTTLLLDTPLAGEQKEFVEIVRRSAQGLLAVINDILDLSKIEAGRLEIESEPFDLLDCVREACELLAPQARSKKLELRFDFAAGGRPVQGDVNRVRQIVLNLVGNAIKFTDTGSVEVRIASSEPVEDRATFQISVKDTGIGIAREHLPLLFSNFTQIDPSVTRKHEGTGLGLAISRRLAQLMGGNLTVTSEIGRGSEFVLTVPLLCQPGNVAETGVRSDPTLVKGLSSRRRRILLAEDNAVNRRLAVRLFEKFGCQVDLASNGREAVEMAGRVPYEAIFMDCRMPELDGCAATREIRSRQSDALRVPVIAMTAHAIVGAREECLASGMDDYISKPIQPADLESALMKWCP